MTRSTPLSIAFFLLLGLHWVKAQDSYCKTELVFPLRAEHNHAPSIVELADGSAQCLPHGTEVQANAKRTMSQSMALD
ncbi:MAG: hypothetical protein LW850_14050 [Planctomycetaceae bacterium]|nr:hypothetical protein [Planctomycetaceae bacterium]